MSHCFQISLSQGTNPQAVVLWVYLPVQNNPPFFRGLLSWPTFVKHSFLEFKPLHPLLPTPDSTKMLSPKFICPHIPYMLEALCKRAPTKRPAEKKSLKILLFKLSESAGIKRSRRHVSAKFGAVCLCHQRSLNNFSFRYFPVRPRVLRCSSHRCISIAFWLLLKFSTLDTFNIMHLI